MRSDIFEILVSIVSGKLSFKIKIAFEMEPLLSRATILFVLQDIVLNKFLKL